VDIVLCLLKYQNNRVFSATDSANRIGQSLKELVDEATNKCCYILKDFGSKKTKIDDDDVGARRTTSLPIIERQ
jgi:hypothetical protein